MRNLTLAIVFLFSLSCQRKPEFYIDGKGYYTQERCIKDTLYTDITYHYGYNLLTQKYEMHWGNELIHECLVSTTDTLAIK